MTDERKPDDVAERAMHIFPLMGRLLEAQMRATDDMLSPVHFHVLRMVASEPQSLSSLAQAQNVSSASMSKTVTVMEERGWLSRRRSQEDRRYVLITITDDGEDRLEAVTRHAHSYLTKAFERLPDDDLQAVDEGLDILIRAFGDVLQNKLFEIDE